MLCCCFSLTATFVEKKVWLVKDKNQGGKPDAPPPAPPPHRKKMGSSVKYMAYMYICMFKENILVLF